MPQETDWLLAPAPIPEPSEIVQLEPATAPKQPRSGPGWFGVVLAVLATIVAMRAIDRLPLTPDDSDDETVVVDVDVDRPHVLVLVDDGRQDRMTAGQAAAANWSGVLSLAKERDFEYRKFDAKSNLDKVEPEFRAMRAKAAEAPSLTIASDGRLKTGPLPGSVADFRKTLEAIE